MEHAKELEESKGLEALRRIKREKPTFFSAMYDSDWWDDDIKTIEGELKELEALKKEMVKVNVGGVAMREFLMRFAAALVVIIALPAITIAALFLGACGAFTYILESMRGSFGD